MAIKSKELAKLLGVSTATMSLVLNHKPGISDELRGSLLSRIQEMGYGYMIKEAEEAETGGSAVSAKNIAYIILADHQEEGDEGAFFPPVIEGAEREARRLGYHFSIIHMYDEKAGRLRESIKKRAVCGNGGLCRYDESGAEEGAGWDGYSVCDAGLLRSGYQGQLRYGE